MILFIKVKPNSRVNKLEKQSDGNLLLRISAPPVDGEANNAVVTFLSKFFSVSKSKITILKGQFSFHKKIEIDLAEEIIKEKIANI